MKYLLILLALSTSTYAAPRSHAAKVAFAKANTCPSTGQNKLPCPGHVIDHIKPLACGGPDIPGNMQWMAYNDALNKDRWERCGSTCKPRQHGAICEKHQ
jgi:hypothetical protein